MALVTFEYYRDTFLGEPIAEESFPRYELRAEELILGLIGRTEAEAEAFAENLPSLLTAIQKAICAQVEYLLEYGIGVAVYGREAGGGFTVGKVSVNNGGSTTAVSGARSMIAPAAYNYLERTGLLNPAVPVEGMPAQYWRWII